MNEFCVGCYDIEIKFVIVKKKTNCLIPTNTLFQKNYETRGPNKI